MQKDLVQWDDMPTPALVIDLAVLDRNIEAMARFAKTKGVVLRPHAKTHKCSQIAQRQIAAGAVGICCAKLGEAEAMAGTGIASILITSPVVSARAMGRLARLHAAIPDLAVVVDHPSMVAHLAKTATPERPLRVFLDVDPGMKRTGVANCEAAIEIARLIDAAPSLIYAGVQFYCGLDQHIRDYDERFSALQERFRYLQDILTTLRSAGYPAVVVTGGGTGSHQIDAELTILTEIQPGSYVFMDEQYLDCLFDTINVPFARSLTVHATVISANHPDVVTIDAGTKALAADTLPPSVLSGAPDGSKFRFMGDEHGVISIPSGKFTPTLRDRIILGVPHCDPTVNLHSDYHVWTGNGLYVWPIEARGRSD